MRVGGYIRLTCAVFYSITWRRVAKFLIKFILCCPLFTTMRVSQLVTFSAILGYQSVMISYYLKDFGNLTGNGQPITGLEADTTYNIFVS